MQSAVTFRSPDRAEQWEMAWPGSQTEHENLCPQGVLVTDLGLVPSTLNYDSCECCKIQPCAVPPFPARGFVCVVSGQ